MARKNTTLYGPKLPGSSTRAWTLIQSSPFSTVPKRKKPQGSIPILSNPTPWQNVRIYSGRTSTTAGGKPVSPYFGVPDLTSLLPPNELVALSDKALAKLQEKIKGEKWNASVTLAELPITQRYMISAAREITDLYLAVKKMDRRKLKKLVKKGKAYLKRRGFKGSSKDLSGTLSKRWMEWRYAVSPLVYDLEDMLSMLYAASVRPHIRRAAAGANQQYSRLDEWEYTDFTVRFSTQGSAHCRAVAYFILDTKAEVFKQLGLINLTATLWEVLPLSFVVDWFLPVGDALGNLDALLGVDVLGCTQSTKEKGRISYGGNTIVTDQGPGNPPYLEIVGGSYSEYEGYNRWVSGLDKSRYNGKMTLTGKQLIDTVSLCRLLLFR